MTNFSTKKDLIDQLTWRYATKTFDASRTIDDATLDTLLESLRLSPSSFGLQPWKFVVISDPGLKQKLKAHSWDQPQITDCSHLVVLCSLKEVSEQYVQDFVEFTANTRGIETEKLAEYKAMMLGFIEKMSDEEIVQWTMRQVYLAQGFFLSAAANLGVDACPMEGFSADDYDEILDLKDSDYSAAVITTIGYRSDDDRHANLAKVRFEKGDVVDMR